jgi:carbonic anhydrase
MTPIYPRRAKSQFAPISPPDRVLALRMGLSAGVCLALMLLMGHASRAWASDAPAAKPAPVSKAAASAAPAPMTAKEVGDQVREAVESGGDAKKKNLTLMVNGKDKKFITLPAGEKPVAHGPAKVADAGHGAAPAQAAAHAATPAMAAPRAMHVADHAEPAVPGRIANPQASRQYIRARAAALTGHEAPSASAGADAHAGEAHWSYDGATGPQAWGSMKPDFNVCAIGKRQSPINIEESATLRGPAEPITFNYTPSDGTVVNNGHTIQVDVLGDNSITVRGTSYKLLQFHFHHPSEERVNYKGFSMVAHLVHKSAEGQLAVVAVLLEPGAVNTLINKVWTYMPLDSGDRVRMPTSLLEMTELLPTDQRYYQFMGSLTTPPCSEGVLWMVLKTPMTVSREQIRLFAQLFPNNARPVQAVNGRAVRNAQ